MAIFYCDLYGGGSDANDGLTPSTPKATINGVTALVTAATDICKIRGRDSMLTDIGTWSWTNFTNTVIYYGGDKTADVPAGTYICKTVALTGTTVPLIWRVASSAYADGNTTVTLTFQNTTTQKYYGGVNGTESVPTSKINLAGATISQQISKNGFLSGTASDLTGRVLSTISGGWDSGYTTQNTYTLLNSNVPYFTSSRNNWKISKFVFIATNDNIYNSGANLTAEYISTAYSNGESVYINGANCYCYRVYQTTSVEDIAFGDYRTTAKECIFLCSRNSGTGQFAGVINDSIIGFNYNTILTSTVINTAINTTFLNINNPFFNSQVVNATGCTFIMKGTTNNLSTGALATQKSYVNCYFDLNSEATGRYVGGLFYPYSSGIWSTNSGATGQTTYFNDMNGTFKSTDFVNLKIATVPTMTAFKFYNLNGGDYGFSGITSLTYNPFIFIEYKPTGNDLYSQYGYTTLSTDYYTGKTGTTGATNSILHVVNTNNAECDFSNVDFVIDKSNSYNLSFYAKGSGSYTLNWNIFNGGEYIYSSWQTQSITAGGWQQITKVISASDWKMSGTATLVIRIPNQAKGTYALIDYIQLT